MKTLNKKNLSLLLVWALSFSILTSQTNFVSAEKSKNSKTINKTLNIKNDQLIQLNGHYAKMWQMQAGGFLPDNPEPLK